MDCSLPGSSVHGIFQARVLEWGAIAFSEVRNYSSCNSFPTAVMFPVLDIVALIVTNSVSFSTISFVHFSPIHQSHTQLPIVYQVVN